PARRPRLARAPVHFALRPGAAAAHVAAAAAAGAGCAPRHSAQPEDSRQPPPPPPRAAMLRRVAHAAALCGRALLLAVEMIWDGDLLKLFPGQFYVYRRSKYDEPQSHVALTIRNRRDSNQQKPRFRRDDSTEGLSSPFFNIKCSSSLGSMFLISGT
ncbi:Protein of unknown function, partial [Gryllus bimaculatus]